MLFKIRDASGERKYLITASNVTELTLTLNKSSKNVLLNVSNVLDRNNQNYSMGIHGMLIKKKKTK